MSAPITPDRVRTDALQPGDRVWHPYDMARFTVSAAPEELDQPLTFHNRATDETECGMRVTGTDDRGDAVHVDTAPSYLWHRDVEQPTAPAEEPPGDTSLTPEREREIRTLDLLELMSDRVAPVISGHLAALLAEVDHLRARVEELVAQRDDALVELVTGQAPPEALSPWERAVSGLNALVDADVIFHVEPDGHIAAPFSDEHIEWDLRARRWVLTRDDEDGAS
ncbi:hypothetical protein OHU11_30155 [Streptomyces sp. NBC_00257]|uniref:hypothetical protein n=1 Tax=unclassified Streptomyces TaxID=2593676 RepID=UPI00224F4D56|nr:MULTISPECIES: hypothetical protein [unclassified Streptomyces]MCX5431917.1 hypothetical protein [Streptomyces sp. NBC_00062]